MRIEFRYLTLSLLFLVLAAGGSALAPCLCAQEAEPEPAAQEPAGQEPAMDEPGDEPAAADDVAADEEKPKAAAKPKPKSSESTEAAEALPDDPAVIAVLESHPQTPAELLRATHILIDLGHAKLAKPFVEQLTKAKLDLTAKAALANQFHSAKLLKLSASPELGAELGPFVDELMKAADAYRRDPARLTDWAKQLSDRDESTRAQAAAALLRAGEASVAPLVNILADPKQAATRPIARAVLVQLGDAAVPPLLGVLESNDAQLKTQVIEVLGRTRPPQAVAQLLAPLISPASTPELRAAAKKALEAISGHLPTSAEALRLLEHAARRNLEQSRIESTEPESPLAVWHWNARRNESMPVNYDASGSRLAIATRLARELYQLDPDHAAHRRLYLVALLQGAKYRVGLDKPLPSGHGTAYGIAARQGVDVLEDVLRDAMAGGYLPAATATAEILGDLGSASLLTRGATTSPLALAAQSADRRLRFAATSAIMKFTPKTPFAGSSQVADGLGFFASSYGQPRVLVVHPRSDEARKIAGLAAELGYEADIATNGRRAFELAIASPDYEFILIHSAIVRPAADELLAQLRRDKRTAQLSVGLIAPWDDLDRVRRFAESSLRTEAFLQPQRVEEMKIFVDQLVARAGHSLVSHEERRKQAIAALDYLIALAARPRHVFDLRRQEAAIVQVLYVPELSTRAANLLGSFGTALGQRSLVELADARTQPLPARQAAADAFARSVEKYGTLLTRDEILQQYDLYNANEGRDGDTGAVLGTILDAMEQKVESARSDLTAQ